MANNENYGFRLNSFARNAKACWQELQMHKDMCDITLVCEDKQYQAHKVVISSCSPVFKKF